MNAQKNDQLTVAVIGAGIMGAGIAQVLATECTVRLFDIDDNQLNDALERIEHGRFGLRASAARGIVTKEQASEFLSRIHVTTDIAVACESVNLVVEAVPEDLALKMRVFKQLDEFSPAGAILTSNSAGLPIVALAHATTRPQQVLGWHWAQPTAVMRLAELVVHPTTSAHATKVVSKLALRLGKNPIVVKDQPHEWGYVANRINAAVRREAIRIVDEGVAATDEVDQLVKDCFRWPMGPFEMQAHNSLGEVETG